MAAKGTKRTKSVKGVEPRMETVNVPWWGPTWGGNRANVPVPGQEYWDFNVPLGYNQNGSPRVAPNTPATPPVTYPTATPMYDPYDTGNVNIGDPNFYYAKNLTTGNPPTGGTYADWQEWNRQMSQNDPNHSYYNPYNTPYAWQWNPNVPGTLIAGADPRSQEGVPWQDALNIPWSSSYAPEYYKNQAPKQYQWLSVSSNGGTMASVGWRRPGRYYLPDQRVTRAGPGGPITAERPPKPSRRGDNDHAGNNQNLSIPAWVGPLVSWRT